MALQLLHREETVNNQSGGDMTLRSRKISKATERRKQELVKASKVNQHLPFLCTCFTSRGKQRKEMISHASKGQIEAISEVALNLLKGNIMVPNSSFKRLKPHKSKLLYLTRKTPSLKKKKEVLNQQGGFLPALASLIAPFALDLLGKVLK